ncbi:hypothetical protein J5X07_07820 [Actinomyces bowdenii]|uniref:hypothetical protein n=1 Tax=Actinomyces bowdenii TaxID=131109 RepID=UPI001ABC05D5|nr:hypothetical protein [Actinomyces bowdenii]MBO3724932.1 hypothetical protein [Actinomyces bowdenii]
MHLVMLETNGNQRYVFSSPRQRENVGGSYLLTMLAPWTLALAQQEGIEATEVSVSSGKIILTVPDEDSARRLIGAVTRRVLALAPGMDVTGVFSELSTEVDGPPAITEADLSGIHVVSGRYALSRPPAEARFPQAPFLQRGHDSVLPAARTRRILWTTPPGDTRYSLASQVKRACAVRARRQLVAQAASDEIMRQALGGDAIKLLADSLYSLERAFDADRETQEEELAHKIREQAAEESGMEDPEDADHEGEFQPSIGDLSKIAVVHIDGNGVGAIMRELQKHADLIPHEIFKDTIGCDKDDPDSLRRFTLDVNSRLDHAVKHSFFTAWAAVAQIWRTEHRASRRVIPVVPILLGGDDLTVLTEGRCALPFMETYLRAYESATSQDPVLRYLGPHTSSASQDGAEQPEDEAATGPMTAAAGAAIVPRPFPFHLAYDLSEKLVKKAKGIGKKKGRECSTLTYHVLFDSTIVDAEELIKDYETFTARPYRLNEVPEAPTSAPSTEDGDQQSQQPPLHGETWAQICALTRHFRGLISEDSPAFPRTRAARIRGLLSDMALAAAQGDTSKAEELETTIKTEWEDARRVLGDGLIDAIEDPRYVFDLLELADLLPTSYLEQAASIPAASAPATGVATASAPATS